MTRSQPSLAVLYEHPDWFEPLFQTLERRGVPYRRLDARKLAFDPSEVQSDAPLLFNRMSPSAHLRGLPGAVSWAKSFLAVRERRGQRVVNGTRAFAFETSKALQVALFDELGVAHPSTRMVHTRARLIAAAQEIGFPVVVKPNLGGSGAGIGRFRSVESLHTALEEGEVDLGPDGTALVQEWVPARDDRITRFEVLDERLLYAIHVTAPPDCYDLCPADLIDGDAEGRRVEAASPPEALVDQAVRVVGAAGMEVGGVEVVVDDRDGTARFYDLNALSNFVAEPQRVVGFDPFDQLASYLEREAHNAGAGRRPERQVI